MGGNLIKFANFSISLKNILATENGNLKLKYIKTLTQIPQNQAT